MKRIIHAGFSLNGELLMDSMGSETAFTDIQGEEFIPAFTLGVGQRARLVFGQDVNALKYFTSCGLQEGYEPFCVYVNPLYRFFREFLLVLFSIQKYESTNDLLVHTRSTHFRE
jgi:hypothetical protein